MTIRPFQRVLGKTAGWRDRLLIMALFGGFSIFGTLIGVELPSGAIMNVRDLGPMLAGLTGGPIAGLGAGLIGGIHRYYLGGFTAFTCSLSTVLAGLVCGFIYLKMNGRVVGIFRGMLIAALVEVLHMGVVLLINRPFDEAVEVVKLVALPMIAANAIGIFFSLRAILPGASPGGPPPNPEQ